MIPDLKKTFRWFGPGDPVSLAAILQTGAKEVVTALHHINCGEIWTKEEIMQRSDQIRQAGLGWSVVESVNVHEDIKTGTPKRDQYIENYIVTLKNLSQAGIAAICYNFMPVLDWTRTDLDYRLCNRASALRFSTAALAAFDLYILERPEALNEFTLAQQAIAKGYLDKLNKAEIKILTATILAGLPGTDEVFTIAEFKRHLKKYQQVDAAALRENLAYFLRAIIPYTEEAGIRMCIHPDDPPFAILGLPRVVSNEDDLNFVINAYPSLYNGITLCTGSLGANPANDLPGIVGRLGSHIHFLHLRNVQREADGSFHEAEHLTGSTDMYAVMKAVINEQSARMAAGRTDISIPLRPDHGHKLLDDFNYNTYPGYSVIGRLKGLAELTGLELGIKRSLTY